MKKKGGELAQETTQHTDHAMMQFGDMFIKATGISGGPFPFQERFATDGEIPGLVDVPTGLGKTAMAVLGWLWRRRFAADSVRAKTTRRLVYCLPMRTLVEQTCGNAVLWLDRTGLLGESGFRSVATRPGAPG